VLHTDASDCAVGAVLQQDFGRGLQPLAFLSKKLDPSQQRVWPVHEKELYAIVQALRTWRHYLQGATHTVQVFTDHVTLRYFHQQRKLSGRQQRWAEIFMDFDLDIVYKRGADNVVADALSRRPDLKALLSSFVLPSDDFLNRIRAAYPSDPIAAQLLQTATAQRGDAMNPACRAIDGLLFFIDEGSYHLYVPADRDLKVDILRDAHDAPSAGHPGIVCVTPCDVTSTGHA
jgi:RNase H-like domain found in reverse transcriptase